MAEKDECLILIKANPHLSGKYFETVCCAGVGKDGKWRRLYPISFRILDEAKQFGRWSWIQYDFREPKNDPRSESQKVQDNTIKIIGVARSSERSTSLESLIFPSFEKPNERGDSLTLIRPSASQFYWKRRPQEKLTELAAKHASLSNQLSLFSNDAEALKPCPYEFKMKWTDQEGNTMEHTCDDWESSATFFKRRKALGSEESALKSMSETFNEAYVKKGFALAFSTHSRRKDQWLLVGMLRADYPVHAGLLV